MWKLSVIFRRSFGLRNILFKQSWKFSRIRKVSGKKVNIYMSVLVFCCFCHRLPQTQWLKAAQMYYYTILETWSGFEWAYVKMLAGCVYSRGSRGGIVSLPFSASGGCLYFLAHGPFHLSSQQQQIELLSHCTTGTNPSVSFFHIERILSIIWGTVPD